MSAPAPISGRSGHGFRLGVATALSLTNAGLGLLAILILAGSLPYGVEAAALSCALAAAVDAVDGTVARRLGVGGVRGHLLDSLCDLVSFGAAPAVAVVLVTADLPGGEAALPVAVGLALVWVFALILRLTRFGMAEVEGRLADPDRFEGLPGPAAAIWALSALLVARDLGLPALASLAILAIGPALMISRRPYPHGRVLARRGWRTGVSGAVIGASCAALLYLVPKFGVAEIAFGLISLYLLMGSLGEKLSAVNRPGSGPAHASR